MSNHKKANLFLDEKFELIGYEIEGITSFIKGNEEVHYIIEDNEKEYSLYSLDPKYVQNAHEKIGKVNPGITLIAKAKPNTSKLQENWETFKKRFLNGTLLNVSEFISATMAIFRDGMNV